MVAAGAVPTAEATEASAGSDDGGGALHEAATGDTTTPTFTDVPEVGANGSASAGLPSWLAAREVAHADADEVGTARWAMDGGRTPARRSVSCAIRVMSAAQIGRRGGAVGNAAVAVLGSVPVPGPVPVPVPLLAPVPVSVERRRDDAVL